MARQQTVSASKIIIKKTNMDNDSLVLQDSKPGPNVLQFEFKKKTKSSDRLKERDEIGLIRQTKNQVNFHISGG